MQIKRIIQAIHTKLAVHQWTALLLCAVMVSSLVSPAFPVLAADVEASAEAEETTETEELKEGEVITEAEAFREDTEPVVTVQGADPVAAAVDGIDEEKYIITKNVVDPENTTVHMFDYWIEGQSISDYRPDIDLDTFLNSGINAGHLFLFAGSDGSSAFKVDNADTVGAWNNYNNSTGYKPYSGIVKKVLDEGYPQLALDELGVEIPSSLNDRNSEDKKTESLAYLFDLESREGKVAYPNVTGLFRLDADGYYYFNSAETFAELNSNQGDGVKTSQEENQITLYDKVWDNNFGTASTEVLGQFFPFNDWSDLFEMQGDNLVQLNNMEAQAGTEEPLNHYFGMTVETKFQQPESGMVTYNSKTQPMTFTFSGDDDIWIFIDDVLVGDLGGLHMRVKVTIDFSTGKIDYTGKLSENPQEQLTEIDSSLYAMYEAAGKLDATDWEEVNGSMLFANGSEHTLKFFYLERGNAASNCWISFNLYNAPKVDTPEEDVDPPEDNTTEQPPEDNTTEQTPVNPPEDNSTSQPPETGVSTPESPVAPKTGDSAMLELWITLLMLSMAGIIMLTTVRYTRKREDKQE